MTYSLKPVFAAIMFTLATSAAMGAVVTFKATGASSTPPVAYSRGSVQIVRAADMPTGADASLPWQPTVGTPFDVEIRSAENMRSPGWFNFSAYKENSGLLIVSVNPEPFVIAPVNQFAPLDILLINEYGEIMQIMPKVILAELKDPYVSEAPMLAALYIKGGTAAQFSIQPGDHVAYKLFKKRPVMLRAGDKQAPKADPAATVKSAPVAPVTQDKPSTNTNAVTAKPTAPTPPIPDKGLLDEIFRRNGGGKN